VTAARGFHFLCLALALLSGCNGTGGAALPLPAPEGLEPQVAARIEELAQRVRAAPEAAGAWGELGMLLDAHRFYAEAAECYRRALDEVETLRTGQRVRFVASDVRGRRIALRVWPA